MFDVKPVLQNAPQYVEKVGLLLKKNSPTILTGLGIVGFVSTVVVACKETPKAITLMEEEQERQDRNEESGPVAKAKMIVSVAPAYLPAVGLGIVSAGCIIGANHVNLQRNAAFVTAYGMLAKEFSEYQGSVAEKFGKKKFDELHDEFVTKDVKNAAVDDDKYIDAGCGNERCFEKYSGRYFRSDAEHLRKIENEINQDMLNDDLSSISLNSVYDHMNLPDIKKGDLIGWNAHDLNSCKELFRFIFTYTEDENENPVRIVSFARDPYPDYEYPSNSNYEGSSYR